MKKLLWHFPLRRTHAGVLLGNGTQGLMVWGEDRLHVTIGHAGFWDHRGGTPFNTRVTFAVLRRMLEAGDEESIRAAFQSGNQGRMRPHQLGAGRLEITFHNGLRPVVAELDIHKGEIEVWLRNNCGQEAKVLIGQAREKALAWVSGDQIAGVQAIPAWHFLSKTLEEQGCKPPHVWGEPESGGFTQALPEDDPLSLAWKWCDGRVAVSTAVGPQAREQVEASLAELDCTEEDERAARWWSDYWRDVPRVSLPDPELQLAWDYGLYKQAGLTPPGSPAATLQGPWMEEYQIPPWSNDYHFNINLEMIYTPALGTNRLSHLEPLWAMMKRWLPGLRQNAENFFGVPEALMLPHAVDDRCQVVGSFWTGTIDHACTAWMAQLAWLDYRYSMEESTLRDIAWPLLVGAFNGYWAMLEEAGPGRLRLPVSVSPEFRGAQMDAWGRDASFQLAACHFLASTLPVAARLLGAAEDPRWGRMARELPPYTIANPDRGIALWEGCDFLESHRHHSHLAAVYPFRTIDPKDPAHAGVVERSIRNWSALGAGNWTGWCLPWAAILCSRCGLADAAVAWLHWWNLVFTNSGYGTLHDADFGGVGGFHKGLSNSEPKPPGFAEVMQMDSGMGVLSAIMELLVQCRGEIISVLPNRPARWRDLEFDGIRTEGAFLVGAKVTEGVTTEVRVRCLAGGHLVLEHGLGAHFLVNGASAHGSIFDTVTSPGESLVLSALKPGYSTRPFSQIKFAQNNVSF